MGMNDIHTTLFLYSSGILRQESHPRPPRPNLLATCGVYYTHLGIPSSIREL